jgi:hypothetical protein
MRFDFNRISLSMSWGSIQVLRESPKGGVGSPTGFARGAGRERALPVWEANQHLPETTLTSKATN